MTEQIILPEIYIGLDVIKSHAAMWLIKLSKFELPISIESALLDIHYSLLPYFNDGINENIMKKFISPNETFEYIKNFFSENNSFKEILINNGIELNVFIFNMIRTLMDEIMRDVITMETFKNQQQITIQ